MATGNYSNWVQVILYASNEGETQPLPEAVPPSAGWYTDVSGAWTAALDKHIGTTAHVQFCAFDSAGNAIDFSYCVAEAGVGSFSISVPMDEAGSTYQVADWNIDIRPDYKLECKTILEAATGDWRDRPVQAYLCIDGVAEKLALGKWLVEDLVIGSQPRLSLVDPRAKLLRQDLYADGIDVATDGGMQGTVEVVLENDTGQEFIEEYMFVNTNCCEIGDWQIEFGAETETYSCTDTGCDVGLNPPGTPHTHTYHTFTITGPGIEREGNIADFTLAADGSLWFYTNQTPNAYGDLADNPDVSQLWISAYCFGSDTSIDGETAQEAWEHWDEGDTITFKTTYSCVKWREEGEGYVHVVKYIYELCRLGGFAPEDFDANPNFPEDFTYMPQNWLWMGHPYVVTADADWISLSDPGASLYSSWDYALRTALVDCKVRLPFTSTCKILDAIGELSKHGPCYIVPNGTGQMEIMPVGGPTGQREYTINSSAGLCTAETTSKAPKTVFRAAYGYDFVDSGDFELYFIYPENRAYQNYGQKLPENGVEFEYLGWRAEDRVQVEQRLHIWHLLHSIGFPVTTAKMGLHGFHPWIGDSYKFESADTATEPPNNEVTVYGITYDFNRLECTLEMLDWQRIMRTILIFQPGDFDPATDVVTGGTQEGMDGSDNKFDGTKWIV